MMTIGFGKANTMDGDCEDLQVAIDKATSPEEEQLPEEIFLRSILDAVSSARPRANVAYCVHALGKRLAQTRNWAVALKTLFVIHHALREADPDICEEFTNYESSNGGHILNLSHFEDDSSPQALDYSAWVRSYAAYLKKRLECYFLLKYGIETQKWNMLQLGKCDLLDHLSELQCLLGRIFACEPRRASMHHNNLIRNAFVLVASECEMIHCAIIQGIDSLVDKLFYLREHSDRMHALRIHLLSKSQFFKLKKLYESWKCLDPERAPQNFKIEPPNSSFMDVMEETRKAIEQSLAAMEEETNKSSKITSGVDENNPEALAITSTENSATAKNVEAVASACAHPGSKLIVPVKNVLRRRPPGYDRSSEAVW